jgi:hypothetical protein
MGYRCWFGGDLFLVLFLCCSATRTYPLLLSSCFDIPSARCSCLRTLPMMTYSLSSGFHIHSSHLIYVFPVVMLLNVFYELLWSVPYCML